MKLVVRIFSLVLLLAAVAAVFLYDGGKTDNEDTTPPVRPVKSIVVGKSQLTAPLRFPGVVDASTGVDLSFEVNGRIVEFPVSRGQQVNKGDILARLDDRDYANQVKTNEAELAYAESNFERMKAALEKNAVSKDEYAKAKATADKARATLDISRKSLEDTKLKARFSGVVSETFADNFDTVSAGTPILKLQDLSVLDLIVSVPESYVLSAPASTRAKFVFEASFDSLPGRVFPVRVKDAALVADTVTQTYRATVSLDAPKDLDILPGMTCTVTAYIPAGEADEADDTQLSVPSNAVGAAFDKSFFVWRLDDNGDGTYTTRRATVTLGHRSGENIFITEGLKLGDRIAVAGVTVLTEGRIVRLTEEAAAADTSAAKSSAPAETTSTPAEPQQNPKP